MPLTAADEIWNAQSESCISLASRFREDQTSSVDSNASGNRGTLGCFMVASRAEGPASRQYTVKALLTLGVSHIRLE